MYMHGCEGLAPENFLTFCCGAQIHPWTIWLFWSSPLMYAMQAISVNEFTAGGSRCLLYCY